jgi:DnaJ-class molecular chaperone
VPKNLTANQKTLLKQFEEDTKDHQPEQSNFKKKIEKLFGKK